MPTTMPEAVRAAHNVSRYPQGYCLRYCREQWSVGALYASAIEAWEGARYKHPGDRNPPTGAPCYYAGGKYGHIVLACPETHPGIRSTDVPYAGMVSDVALGWCPDNWNVTYLGWSEDLNGVRLPLDQKEDDMPHYREWSDADKRALSRDVADAVWQRVTEVKKPDDTKTEKATLVMLKEVWQRVARL